MKKLTKIKLINWHLFSNQTINIDNNTLVSGENGAGKSTFLDAIQFLLVGGSGGVKFNIAANTEAKRTLDGYVRGKIGAENKEYLRTGDVITHIALEFYDETKKTYSIIGAVLDLPKNSSLKQRFYLLEEISINEEMYISKDKPRDYKQMKEYLKEQGIDFDYFETQKKYRDALAKFFGIDAIKYSKLLPKALAFKPEKLEQLVFNFLLDDDPIDIQSLKNNVNQLKKIEAQIKSDKEKLEKLDKISQVGGELEKHSNEIKTYELVSSLNFLEQKETYMQRAEQEISQFERDMEILRKEKFTIDKNIEANDKRILELEKAKGNNNLSKTIDAIKNDIINKKKEYDYEHEITDNLRDLIDKEAKIINEVMGYVNDNAFKDFVDYYYSHKGNFLTSELQARLEQVSIAISSYDKAFYLNRENINQSKADLSQKLNFAKNQLNSLERNLKPYPSYVISLVNMINEELSNRYQKEINARPLADLIDIKDESWRNAVEGYLNTQRFDIIIDPIYFDEALEIYDQVDQIEGDRKIYGVGLVNTKELDKYQEVKDGSLASKIESDHIYARRYCNMLLNNVVCVETRNELKHYPRSITKKGMTYANYTARRINPKNWEIPFIGQAATDKQIEIAKNNVAIIEQAMRETLDSTDKNDEVTKLLQSSKAQTIIQQNQLKYFESVKELRRDLNELENRLESYTKDNSLQSIELALDKEFADKRAYKLKSDVIVGKIANLREHREKTIEQLEESKTKYDSYVNEQKEIAAKHPEKLAIAQSEFNQLKDRYALDFDRISEHIAKTNVSVKQQIPRLENQVVNLMRDYMMQYSFDCEPIAENLNHFIQEGNQIRNQNLVKYELQAVELRAASEKSFKEEFVNKLRASIQSAQAQIDELNVALEGKTFGQDQYRLVHFPSLDPEYKLYYNLIMGANDSEQDLFTDNLSVKNEKILMELFEKIASDDPQYDKLALNYLDYRHYMTYDIEITNANGNVSYFSKVEREKSGGETQVPFYIVIAASFQQLLSHNARANSGCIVLFDEAFNNMDESRIEAMMRFYNSLSIQLFISIPPQRVPNIINYVNTSLIIVKHNDQSAIQEFIADSDIS